MGSRTQYRLLITALTGALLVEMGLAIASEDPAIRPYEATYQISYKGRIVGRSEFSLQYDEYGNHYQFSSTSRFHGLLRFIAPKPLIQRSVFLSKEGTITPLEFWFEDGSNSGRDNIHIIFDWNEDLATVISAEQQNQYPITQNTLDPGTIQVQFMLDLARSASLNNYTLVDENGLKTYSNVVESDQRVQTALGKFSTRVFVQEREGSSRQTLIWAAPKLHQLPVRIEQKNDSETHTVFLLESINWRSNLAE